MTQPTDPDQPESTDPEQSLPSETGPDHPGWGSAPVPPPPPSATGPTDPFGGAPVSFGSPPPPPPPSDYPVPGHPWVAPAPAQTSGKATAAMVVGIVSIIACCIGFVPGIVAICLAVSARQDIRRQPGYLGGEGMATAGLVTGIIGTALWIVIDIITFLP